MKKTPLFFPLALLPVLLLTGCDKEKYYGIKILPPDAVTTTSAKFVADLIVKEDRPPQIDEYGFFYYPEDDPAQNNNYCSAKYDGFTGYFSATVNDLIPSTVYIVQAFIKVEYTMIKSASITFKTLDPEPEQGTFTDSRDGHVYIWIRIGKQVWMGENLAWIPSISKPEEGSETDRHYYIYGDDGSSQGQTPDTYKKFGALYNWPAAINACPEGWHLPTDPEWSELTSWLAYPEGSKMKEVGSAHWTDKNTDATNSSNFSARAGGEKYYLGGFIRLGTHAYFWTGTSKDDKYSWDRSLLDTGNRCLRGNSSKASGYSVRCVKN